MQKRYAYSLLFGIPGLFIAGVISIFLFASLTGILGIYVLGNDPWPAYARQLLSTLFVFSVLTLWLATIVIGYVVGRRLEKEPGWNRVHVLLSAGLTLLLLLLMVFQRFSTGSFGSREEAALCRDFCTTHGNSGSKISSDISGSGICSCYDDSGDEVFRIPLDHLDLDN